MTLFRHQALLHAASMNIKKEIVLLIVVLSALVAFACIAFAEGFSKRLASKTTFSKRLASKNTFGKRLASKTTSKETNAVLAHKAKIAVLMLTSHHTAKRRLPVMRQLYDSEKAVVKSQIDTFYVTDRDLAMPALAPWRQMIATGCSDTYTGGLCCKLQFAYTLLFAQSYDWVLRVVDDGYVNYANLLAYTQSLNASEALYLGEHYLHLTANTRPYADGGAGWLMSRPALALAVPILPQFWQHGDENCYDDMQFGRFMIDTVKLPVRQGKGMHNENLAVRDGQIWQSPRHGALHSTLGDHPLDPIISWHSTYNDGDFSHILELQAQIRRLAGQVDGLNG